MLEQVERREYHTKVPAWIKKLMKKKEKKLGERDRHQRGGGGGDSGRGGESEQKTRCQFGNDSERAKKIQIANPQEGCMLQLTEHFRDLFHPGNVRNQEKPKLAYGTPMCLRIHSLGFCFAD